MLKKADEDNEEVIRMIEEGFISSDNDQLLPEFPVFTQEVLDRICDQLESAVNKVYDCMEKICGIATETLIIPNKK